MAIMLNAFERLGGLVSTCALAQRDGIGAFSCLLRTYIDLRSALNNMLVHGREADEFCGPFYAIETGAWSTSRSTVAATRARAGACPLM